MRCDNAERCVFCNSILMHIGCVFNTVTISFYVIYNLRSVIESSTHPEVTKWLQDYVAAWKQHLSPKPIRDSSADDDTPVSPEVLAADVKLYAEQYKEYKLKNLAFTNRVLNISLKQYAHHFIADDAPFSIIK